MGVCGSMMACRTEENALSSRCREIGLERRPPARASWFTRSERADPKLDANVSERSRFFMSCCLIYAHRAQAVCLLAPVGTGGLNQTYGINRMFQRTPSLQPDRDLSTLPVEPWQLSYVSFVSLSIFCIQSFGHVQLHVSDIDGVPWFLSRPESVLRFRPHDLSHRARVRANPRGISVRAVADKILSLTA